MRTKTRIAGVVIALAMLGGLLASPTLAEDITVVDLSMGFTYEEDFQSSDGGWTTTEVPPPPEADRPPPVNSSWEHGDVPSSVPRPPVTNPQWEWGVPTSGPGQAHSGANVWATNLSGPYAVPTCAAIMSPPIDLTGAGSASVDFQHWVHMDTGSTLAFHMGLIFVTTDGGKTLTRVVPQGGYNSPAGGTSSRACLDAQPTGTTGFSGGPSAGWTPVSVGLDAFAGQQVQIVLGMGSDSSGANFNGWYMDTFAVTVDGVTQVEDFETGDGGFTVATTAAPAGLLPPGAASGDKAWATYLGGALSRIECAGIISPPIDLSTATSASVSFQHWSHMRQLTTSAPQAAIVFATKDAGKTLQVIQPAGGYTSQPITLTATRTCLNDIPSGTRGISGGPSDGWQPLNFDLPSDLLGEDEVQIVVGFRKDSTGDFSGLYLDDFVTTVNGATTAENFESGDGGFSVVSTQPPVLPPYPKGWEWGVPTSGPNTDGAKVWATKLHEDYGHLECSWIESPAFQVGTVPSALGEVVEATLSWDHWIRTNSTYASGVVQVGHNGEYHVIEPEGGYPATIGSTSSTFAEVTQWQTDCFGMDWAPGDPLPRGYSGTTTSAGAGTIGGPMSANQADLSDYAGEEITLRFIFASGWRDANPTTQPGWYINNVDVETRVVVKAPSPEDLLKETRDAPGWSSGGPGSQWEFGAAMAGPNGDLAYGTNLSGPYGTDHCGYIESPAVAGSTLAQDPTLRFDHWYALAQSGSFAWKAGVVLISTDDGASWAVLGVPGQLYTASTASRNCVRNIAGVPTSPTYSGFGGRQQEWSTVEADLSAFAAAESVKLRFVMGSDAVTNTGCTDDDPCQGWFIRNVVLGGTDIGPGTVGSVVYQLPLP